jgi:hypothetical protein
LKEFENGEEKSVKRLQLKEEEEIRIKEEKEEVSKSR